MARARSGVEERNAPPPNSSHPEFGRTQRKPPEAGVLSLWPPRGTNGSTSLPTEPPASLPRTGPKSPKRTGSRSPDALSANDENVPLPGPKRKVLLVGGAAAPRSHDTKLQRPFRSPLPTQTCRLVCTAPKARFLKPSLFSRGAVDLLGPVFIQNEVRSFFPLRPGEQQRGAKARSGPPEAPRGGPGQIATRACPTKLQPRFLRLSRY